MLGKSPVEDADHTLPLPALSSVGLRWKDWLADWFWPPVKGKNIEMFM